MYFYLSIQVIPIPISPAYAIAHALAHALAHVTANPCTCQCNYSRYPRTRPCSIVLSQFQSPKVLPDVEGALL